MARFAEQDAFPDYREYYNGDQWPSLQGRDVTLSWVGDMAPQYCASGIWKVRRWCNEQWSDELMNEREWSDFTVSRLYYHLASRAICNDFTEAALTPDLPPEGLSVQGVVRLMNALLHLCTSLDESHIGMASKEIALTLEAGRYLILKGTA